MSKFMITKLDELIELTSNLPNPSIGYRANLLAIQAKREHEEDIVVLKNEIDQLKKKLAYIQEKVNYVVDSKTVMVPEDGGDHL